MWVRDPSHKCDVESLIGMITNVISTQMVEVDGMPHHGCDLRPAEARINPEPEPKKRTGGTVVDDESLVIQILTLRMLVLEDEETSDCAQTNDGDGVAESVQETSGAQQNTDKDDGIEEGHLEDADPNRQGGAAV